MRERLVRSVAWARSVAIVGVVTLGILGAAGAAEAKQTWGTVTLTDGSVSLGSGYGSTYRSESAGSKFYVSPSPYKDLHHPATDYPIYVKSSWHFNGTFCYPAGEGGVGCGSGWYASGSTASARTNSSSTAYLSKALSATADSVRASIQVCEDRRPLKVDKCTTAILRGASY